MSSIYLGIVFIKLLPTYLQYICALPGFYSVYSVNGKSVGRNVYSKAQSKHPRQFSMQPVVAVDDNNKMTTEWQREWDRPTLTHWHCPEWIYPIYPTYAHMYVFMYACDVATVHAVANLLLPSNHISVFVAHLGCIVIHAVVRHHTENAKQLKRHHRYQHHDC